MLDVSKKSVRGGEKKSTHKILKNIFLQVIIIVFSALSFICR